MAVLIAGNTPVEEAAQRPSSNKCPICYSRRLYYAFSKQGYRIVRCHDCLLLFLNPQPSDNELEAIYSPTYFLGEDTVEAKNRVSAMKRATARYYLDVIGASSGGGVATLLEIGCGQGDLLLEALDRGYKVTGVEYSASSAELASQRVGERGTVLCGDLRGLPIPESSFDVCVLSDLIEHVRDPVDFLSNLRRLLKPEGVIFITTPTLDSWSARLMRQNWMEFKPEHLFYFDTNTIQHALFQAGYHQVRVTPGGKVLNLEYISNHFKRFPVPLTPLISAGAQVLPQWLGERNFRIVASGMIVLARADAQPDRRKLSVIVPAYNEAATLDTLMQILLQKQLPDLEMEFIIVESNSTDGTREIALKYKDDPRVRIVLEDQPRGKGAAVRKGLQYASGDFILIQDADLEYDIEDYDVLLEPLVCAREAFVLGSRHGGDAWKMRHFSDLPLLGLALNFGHLLFTTYVNLLLGLRLKDPFTMFKVFRRDCIFGLNLTCNRFDFDFELLIKLARKGYRPVEIPVNYRSRSFKEGKKVNVWRDPWTWIWAALRSRFASL